MHIVDIDTFIPMYTTIDEHLKNTTYIQRKGPYSVWCLLLCAFVLDLPYFVHTTVYIYNANKVMYGSICSFLLVFSSSISSFNNKTFCGMPLYH